MRFLSFMNQTCLECKKPIKFIGYVFTPRVGPLKNVLLYFDSQECLNKYKEKYNIYLNDSTGYESQCINVKA